MGNLLCPLGADWSHFSPTLALLCLQYAQSTGLVTLERKRHHVGGIWGWDCQPVWPIGGSGAFMFPWERWQLGLVLRHSFQKRMHVRHICVRFLWVFFFF